MRFAILKLSACGLGLTLLAGCGGGGSSSGGGGGTGGGSPTIVTVKFVGVAPTAIATKVGSGTLTAATLSSGAVSLTVPSGTSTFAVAYLCPTEELGGSGITYLSPEFLMEATIADGTSYTIQCRSVPTAGQSGMLTGTVDATGVAAPAYYSLIVQAMNGNYVSDQQIGAQSASVNLAAPEGSDRIDIGFYDFTPVGYQTRVLLMAAKTFQNQQVPGQLDSGNTVTLTAADVPTYEPISFSGLGSGAATPVLIGDFQPTGQVFGMELVYGDATEYPVLPAGVTRGGGSYNIEGTAYDSSCGCTLIAASAIAQPAPLTLAFPNTWSYAGPATAAFPTMNFSSYAGLSGQPGLSYSAAIYWNTGTSTEREIEVDASANYVGSSLSLTVPDLSSLAGFWGAPASGTTEFWTASVFASDAGTLLSNAALMSAGHSLRGVQTSGAFTTP